MGTTLTGTTPQDTYDSLIKVTDNGPLSGTAKYLSDGLGNDSVLALSTSAAGVGTTTMARKFNIDGGSITSDTPTLRISSTDGSGTRKFGIEFYSNSGADVRGKLLADNSGKVYLDDNGGGGVVLQANGGTGNVGIGTSSPVAKLAVSDGTNALQLGHDANGPYISGANNAFTVYKRLSYDATDHVFFSSSAERFRITNNGVTFNGDTAAANALDDYEEGTFTPVLGGTTGDPTVTYATGNTGGIYTKIGNKVTVSFEVRWTALSGGSGDVIIKGLPFTRKTTNQPDGDHSIVQAYDVTFTGSYLIGNVGSSTTLMYINNVNSGAASTALTVASLPTSPAQAFLRATATYFV